jgi:cytoskeletal protein CcmA (bactofilin family)
MRIDGNIIGNVTCKAKIVLGESAIIQGDVHVANADIFGTVNGNVTVEDLLSLKSKCTINGNLSTARLQIEPNAVFNGKCSMTSGKPANAVAEDVKPLLVVGDN